jgi:chromosome segregation ATPase
MNEAEYVLRLILRARDELSSKLTKVRTELKGLEKDSANASKGFDELNKRITSANTRIGNLTDKMKEARKAFRDLASDEDKVSKSSKSMAGDVDDVAESIESMAEKTANANKKLGELQAAHRRTDEEFRKGNITRDQAAKSYNRIAQELDQLAKKTPVASDSFFDVTDLSNKSRESVQVVKDTLAAEKKLRDEAIADDRRRQEEAAARTERRIERDIARDVALEKDRAAQIAATRAAAEADALDFIKQETERARRGKGVDALLDAGDAREIAQRTKLINASFL